MPKGELSMSATAVEKLLNDDQAADLLGIRPQTLAVWRMTGRHSLPFVRVGRAVRYRMSDLLAWLDSRTVGGATHREKQTA